MSKVSTSVDQNDKKIVRYEDINKIYSDGDDRVVALQDVNLEITSGDFVSFVGPSGCGKTTLLHLTGGLLEPTNGRVIVDGNDVQTEAHKKHNVGLVFQQPVLLEWRSVIKNVLLPVEIMIENDVLDDTESYYRERAEDLLSLVGLEGFEEAYPRELSGGMQQRVAICRSLIYDPPVLLMDEPFGALDAFTREQLNEELLRIWRDTDKTILFVTHNLEEAIFLSDYVVALSPRPGKIVDVIDVDLDRPRDDETRTDPRFHELLDRANDHFRGMKE